MSFQRGKIWKAARVEMTRVNEIIHPLIVTVPTDLCTDITPTQPRLGLGFWLGIPGWYERLSTLIPSRRSEFIDKLGQSGS